MKDVIKHLRDAWYGNGDAFILGHPLRKRPVDCRALWSKCLKITGQKFVELCDGVSGEIGSLVRDEDFTNESVALPIDTLVVDLTKDDEEGALWGTVCDI